MKNNLIDALKKSDLFKNINNDLEKILDCLDIKRKEYSTDEILIHNESEVSAIGIIIKGSALITKEDIDGNRIIIANIRESDMFGEAIVGANKKSPVTVITATGCEVIYIDIKRIITACGSLCPFHTQLIKNLIENICTKNLFLNSRIDILTQKTLRDKLITYLNIEAKRKNSNVFYINFSREELADFLFTNRSAMSRELSKMQSEGLIKYKKNKFYLNFNTEFS